MKIDFDLNYEVNTVGKTVRIKFNDDYMIVFEYRNKCTLYYEYSYEEYEEVKQLNLENVINSLNLLKGFITFITYVDQYSIYKFECNMDYNQFEKLL